MKISRNVAVQNPKCGWVSQCTAQGLAVTVLRNCYRRAGSHKRFFFFLKIKKNESVQRERRFQRNTREPHPK